MSTLTEAQFEKLFGRKRKSLPSNYLAFIRAKLTRALKEVNAGEMSKSQLGMVLRN